MKTRLLILNADPVFQDDALAICDEIDSLETRIVRTISEAVGVLLAENFDGFVNAGTGGDKRPRHVRVAVDDRVVKLCAAISIHTGSVFALRMLAGHVGEA